MALYRFRVAWEDDDNVYRDIELISGQTFQDFKLIILKSYELEDKYPCSFYESTDKFNKLREISSEVLANKKGAEKLSIIKTPVPALVDVPDKKFVFEIYQDQKTIVFLISLVGLSKDDNYKLVYPRISRTEGIAILHNGIKGVASEKIMEIEEKYDLGRADMDEGFGDEGEDNDTDNDSDSDEEGMDYGVENDDF